jgi:cytochrome c551/c552
MAKRMTVFLSLLALSLTALAENAGDKLPGYSLFKAYCWGCHHQTAEAFGPSFRTIASKRNRGEIISQIVDPADTAKRLGYRRSSMPAFADLNATQLELLADFILSFKESEK